MGTIIVTYVWAAGVLGNGIDNGFYVDYFMVFVRILEGIGNWNVIWFGNYNRHMDGVEMLTDFVLFFGIRLKIYEALK